MNFMGMGIPELGVILLVAFLVLGPARAIDMARSAGKIIGDLRRSFGDVTSAIARETTVLLIEHNRAGVMELAERITGRNDGAILAEGAPAEIAANAEVQRAYLGT